VEELKKCTIVLTKIVAYYNAPTKQLTDLYTKIEEIEAKGGDAFATTEPSLIQILSILSVRKDDKTALSFILSKKY